MCKVWDLCQLQAFTPMPPMPPSPFLLMIHPSLHLQAMNRSLANVILGGYGVSKGPAMEVEGSHTETDAASVIEMLTGAKDVIIVPGKLLKPYEWQNASPRCIGLLLFQLSTCLGS